MNGLQFFNSSAVKALLFRIKRKTAVLVTLAAICPGFANIAHAQVEESAQAGGLALSAGGTFSGYYVGYGQRKMVGPTAFVDFGSRSPFSIEAEARWLDLHETAGVHDETYLAGPRYAFKEVSGFRPYAKFLIGDGEFTFPYNLAHGSYFVVAPGVGVERRLSKRVYWRVVDFEYQYWSQFTYGSLPSYGISSGLRVHIF
jgi:hypothetical protein